MHWSRCDVFAIDCGGSLAVRNVASGAYCCTSVLYSSTRVAFGRLAGARQRGRPARCGSCSPYRTSAPRVRTNIGARISPDRTSGIARSRGAARAAPRSCDSLLSSITSVGEHIAMARRAASPPRWRPGRPAGSNRRATDFQAVTRPTDVLKGPVFAGLLGLSPPCGSCTETRHWLPRWLPRIHHQAAYGRLVQKAPPGFARAAAGHTPPHPRLVDHSARRASTPGR
jgi:hypothetical protein